MRGWGLCVRHVYAREICSSACETGHAGASKPLLTKQDKATGCLKGSQGLASAPVPVASPTLLQNIPLPILTLFPEPLMLPAPLFQQYLWLWS